MTDALNQIQIDLAAMTAAGSHFGQTATLTTPAGSSQTVRMIAMPVEAEKSDTDYGQSVYMRSSALITDFTAAPKDGDTLTDEAGFVWQVRRTKNHLAGGIIAELLADTPIARHDGGYRSQGR